MNKIREFIRKVEFSKLLCGIIAAVIGAVAIYAIFRYYSLMKLAIETGSAAVPDATLAVTCVGTLLGAFLSYCLYQFGLKNSRNKYGIDADGQPYRHKIEEYVNDIETEENTYDYGNHY